MTVYFLYTVTVSQVSLMQPEVLCANVRQFTSFFCWLLTD